MTQHHFISVVSARKELVIKSSAFKLCSKSAPHFRCLFPVKVYVIISEGIMTYYKYSDLLFAPFSVRDYIPEYISGKDRRIRCFIYNQVFSVLILFKQLISVSCGYSFDALLVQCFFDQLASRIVLIIGLYSY